MKTSELIGPTLDWVVWSIIFKNVHNITQLAAALDPNYSPSTRWSQGGPIIFDNKIGVYPSESPGHVGEWVAITLTTAHIYGPTPLVAAMRCFCASKLGDEVDVPEELLK